VVEALAILINLAIFAFPFKLVWGLQMQRSMKFWVLVGFGIRLPYVHPIRKLHCLSTTLTDIVPSLIPIAIIRLMNLSTSLTSEEYLLDSATTEYYTQAEMTFSLIAATIPCLRMFMEAAKTGLLGVSTWEDETTTGSYMKSYKGNKTGATSRTQDTVSKQRDVDESIQFCDMNGGSCSVHARAASSKGSVTSDGSKTAIIVRQTVDVTYG
jgi:hypothetical protein